MASPSLVARSSLLSPGDAALLQLAHWSRLLNRTRFQALCRREPGELTDVERLTPRARVQARRPEQPLGLGRRAGPAGQRGPQRLAPLPERRIDDREHLLAAGHAFRRIAPGERDQA